MDQMQIKRSAAMVDELADICRTTAGGGRGGVAAAAERRQRAARRAAKNMTSRIAELTNWLDAAGTIRLAMQRILIGRARFETRSACASR